MTPLGGFWSYAHADDAADYGRIVELARDVAAQYEMLTGESIEVFLDRDDLEWGNEWRAKVDGSLATVAFFIPVLTPRYFQSPECRRELRTFAAKAEQLGLTDLLLPLLYVNFPAVEEENPSDELVALIKRYQWVDWRDLRFSERGSGEYRRGVSELAQRLVAANLEAAKNSLSPPILVEEPGSPEEDGNPGLIDRIADAETTLPSWAETVDKIGAVIEQLGSLMQAASEQMEASDKKGKGFAGRLLVARNLANLLNGPADEIVDLGNKFAQELGAVDSGVRAIIDFASGVAKDDPEERAAAEEFFSSIRGLSVATNEGLGQVSLMIDQMTPIEKMSRDLREPLKRLRLGLTAMVEGRQITSEWVRLIDDSGI